MRFESMHSLILGAVLFAVVYFSVRGLKRPFTRSFLLAVAFAGFLGVAIVPGHGEIVAAPVMRLLPMGGPAAFIGAFYFAVWLGVALVVGALIAAKSATVSPVDDARKPADRG